MRRRLAGLLVALAACSSSKAPDGGLDALPGDARGDAEPLDGRTIGDGGTLIPHDAGGLLSCRETCDCPQGLGCIAGECRTAGVGPVYCCTRDGCPVSSDCLGPNDRPGRCAPPAPDAGTRDVGIGAIGASCNLDNDCDQNQGFSCWDQSNPPFLWGGYCTVRDCLPACPVGSTCIGFNGTFPIQGCMATCAIDQDCRADAYCLTLPGTAIQICYPNCRDDLIDCGPRNGTMFCSRITGRCEITPAQSPTAQVGDACTDSTQCGAGEVCMDATVWRTPGGMCTRVCAGLPEATACQADEICEPIAGVGLCFKSCVAGMCPNRAGALCGLLDPTWIEPACITM